MESSNDFLLETLLFGHSFLVRVVETIVFFELVYLTNSGFKRNIFTSFIRVPTVKYCIRKSS